MSLSNVVNELHDNHGLTNTSSTEGSHFTTLREGANEVDDFNACLENFSGCCLINQRRCWAVNGILLVVCNWPTLVNSIAGNVEDTTKNTGSNRNGNRCTSIGDFNTTLETIRSTHGNGTNPAVTEVLLNFENECAFFAVKFIGDFKSIINGGQLICFGEISVDNGANNLNDGSFVGHKSNWWLV